MRVSKGLVICVLAVLAGVASFLAATTLASSDEMEAQARLAGAAINGVTPEGEADFRSRVDGRRRFKVEVEDVNLPAGTLLNVLVDNVKVGTLTINDQFSGELELDSNNGQVIPTVNSGTKVMVTDQTGSVIVAGDFPATPTPTPTPTPGASPIPTPMAGTSTVQFASRKFRASENSGSVTITVTRAGSTADTVTVDFNVGNDDDGSDTAKQQSDFTLTSGTLTFAPGDTAKTFDVLINKVRVPAAREEEAEMVLSNVKGPGATLGDPSKAELEIENDDVQGEVENPIDDHENFIHQHYHDFLNREPDAGGLQFWKQKIDACGTDARCMDGVRTAVSAAFYMSPEFQLTGFFVYKLDKLAFNERPRFTNFIPQVQKISREMLERNLEASRQDFINGFVDSPEFHAQYDGMSNEQYVDELYRNAEVTPDPATRIRQVDDLNNNRQRRGDVLRDIAENNQELNDRQYNPAFVLMQYFGYLRRDPDEAGYQFWVKKLNGESQRIEHNNYPAMVQAFLKAAEYRDRFHH